MVLKFEPGDLNSDFKEILKRKRALNYSLLQLIASNILLNLVTLTKEMIFLVLNVQKLEKCGATWLELECSQLK